MCDRMDKESEKWGLFLETLWEFQGFQGFKDKNSLTKEVKEAFYYSYQGITAVVGNLFILAQDLNKFYISNSCFYNIGYVT